jgi:hypothetical protein
MALGNSNNSAQTRGKNKPILVKRRKEVVAAKGYNSFTSSVVQSRSACSYRGSIDQTYYHNGRGALPVAGDKVYRVARANDRYLLADGHYKISDNRGGFRSIPVTSGVVGSVTNCR